MTAPHAPATALRPHLAHGHDLPVSKGYQVRRGAVAVWCGWCGGLYRADQEWANRYLRTLWRRLAAEARSDRTRVTYDYARRKIGEARAAFAAAGLRPTWRLPRRAP